MLASAAGTSVGLIYAHFRSKGALLEEIVQVNMRAVEASFDKAESAAATDERIEQMLHASGVVLREHIDFWKLSYAVQMQPPIVDELGDEVGEWLSGIHTAIVRGLRHAGSPEPEVEAEILVGLLDGISQHYVLQPDLYPLDRVVERLLELYRRLRIAPALPRAPQPGPARRSETRR